MTLQVTISPFDLSFNSSNGLPLISRIESATFSLSFEIIFTLILSPTLYFFISSLGSESQDKSLLKTAPSISPSRLQKSIPSLILVISVSSILPIGLSSLNFCHGFVVSCFIPRLSLLFSWSISSI